MTKETAEENWVQGTEYHHEAIESLMHCTGKVITQWNEIAEQITGNTNKFAKEVLIFSLPINTNLKRWYKISNDKCLLCNGEQT